MLGAPKIVATAKATPIIIFISILPNKKPAPVAITIIAAIIFAGVPFNIVIALQRTIAIELPFTKLSVAA